MYEKRRSIRKKKIFLRSNIAVKKLPPLLEGNKIKIKNKKKVLRSCSMREPQRHETMESCLTLVVLND